MKRIKTTASIIISIATTALLILSCGGGGGSSTTPPPTQSGSLTTSNAASASGAVITTINLMIEPSYIGTVSYDLQDNGITKKSFLNALLNQAIQNIQKTQTKRTISGSTDQTTTCTGGGTKKETSNWTGSDSNPENYTGTITYIACKEGTAVWNGTTAITYQGTYQNPTKITTTLNNMTYTDTNTNLSLTGLAITYDDITYNGDDVTSASAAITGNITGTINGKNITAGYNNFKIAYSFSANNINITLSGKITPVCVNSELTTTSSAITIPIGSKCPISGDITITDGTSNAKMSFTSQGGMSVQFNDQTTASYDSCSQSEGVCL